METIRPQKQPKEETLEPVGWREFRKFAHNVLVDAISHASGIRQLPVWQGGLYMATEGSSERKRVS
jgi:hypothetical protein